MYGHFHICLEIVLYILFQYITFFQVIMVKLFVGNLVEDIDSGIIRQLFEEFGNVEECDVLGKFGFVVRTCCIYIIWFKVEETLFMW